MSQTLCKLYVKIYRRWFFPQAGLYRAAQIFLERSCLTDPRPTLENPEFWRFRAEQVSKHALLTLLHRKRCQNSDAVAS
jgi:hypothetical protein